ncbi:MAG: gliding motility-associated C-terminal domain-containing protein [Flavobacteriales bacterium]|nr:gliding motility-associated C-terminal domain-containing protein [Flavobacteriales bacterium]
MKKLFSLSIIILFISINNLQSQVTVDNTSLTIEQYIQNALVGSGVTISNVQFNGGSAAVSNEQVGSFNDVNSDVGLPNGLILGSGDVTMASQANTSGGSSSGGTGNQGVDTDLASITSNQIFDECVIEFDFSPVGDTISFQYVFASEEYDEYVCGNVNDAFGFFLTGNNPAGGTYNAKNIALIPNPSNPSTFTNTPVSINTVNLGFAGTFGSLNNCTALDPNFASYKIFYTPNTVNTYEYDGRTVVLTAKAPVNCGEIYHIKLAIGDGGDGSFDSGVFLGSLSSSGVGINTNLTTIIEECNNATVTITRSDTLFNDTISLAISGNAILSEYSTIDTVQIFDPGKDSLTFNVSAFIDNITEGIDTIIIGIQGNTGCNMVTLYIEDYTPMSITVSDSMNICTELGETAEIWANVSNGRPPYTYLWDNGIGSGDTLTVNPEETTNYISTVWDACGNSITSEIVPIWVQCQLIPTNVFTPNGDGMNDFFTLINLDDYPAPSVKVYNRWGKLVYENKAYQNDWDGDNLKEGTYFYIIEPNSKKFEYDSNAKEELKHSIKGTVHLFR